MRAAAPANSRELQQETKGDDIVCTPVCTNSSDSANGDPVMRLAASLSFLSPDDRARLAALLIAKPE